mgnify:CR=1 FL=1
MKQYTSLYFVGAGGIGMSALVRYFLAKGYKVAGYDRTQSPLTTELKAEGLEIVYEESVESIPDYCRIPRRLWSFILRRFPQVIPDWFISGSMVSEW